MPIKWGGTTLPALICDDCGYPMAATDTGNICNDCKYCAVVELELDQLRRTGTKEE